MPLLSLLIRLPSDMISLPMPPNMSRAEVKQYPRIVFEIFVTTWRIRAERSSLTRSIRKQGHLKLKVDGNRSAGHLHNGVLSKARSHCRHNDLTRARLVKLFVPYLDALALNFTSGVNFAMTGAAITFGVHNTGPLGCLPQKLTIATNRNTGEYDQYGCLQQLNDRAKAFNKKLKALCDELRSEMGNATIVNVKPKLQYKEAENSSHRDNSYAKIPGTPKPNCVGDQDWTFVPELALEDEVGRFDSVHETARISEGPSSPSQSKSARKLKSSDGSCDKKTASGKNIV
ncbi:GDSL lipase/esterase [Dillenia turbinata]|uniref:GDSL lipase/esterase n=1 Tax=Dillenia turbinata TaxID=194707 RepID=A0AAN8ZHB2_9MAGN